MVSVPSGRTHPKHSGITSQSLLLACGILAPLLYVGSDIAAALLWEAYSFPHQTVSELRAFGAPTRPFLVPALLLYSLLEIALGVGVLRAAGPRLALRLAGWLFVALGLVDLTAPFFSMQLRGAGFGATDMMHIALAGVDVLLLLLVLGFGGVAFGRGFLIYTVLTIVAMIAFGSIAGIGGQKIAEGLPTPWIGIYERINIYGAMLWIGVFAVTLLLRKNEAR